MKISKRNSTCMSVDKIKRLISHGTCCSMYTVKQPSGYVVLFGHDYQRVDEDLFVSIVHSRPLHEKTYRSLLNVVNSTLILVL